MQLSTSTFPNDPALGLPFDGASFSTKTGRDEGGEASHADFSRMLSAESNGSRHKTSRGSSASRSESSATKTSPGEDSSADDEVDAAHEDSDGSTADKPDVTAQQNVLATMLSNATATPVSPVNGVLDLSVGAAGVELVSSGQASAATTAGRGAGAETAGLTAGGRGLAFGLNGNPAGSVSAAAAARADRLFAMNASTPSPQEASAAKTALSAGATSPGSSGASTASVPTSTSAGLVSADTSISGPGAATPPSLSALTAKPEDVTKAVDAEPTNGAAQSPPAAGVLADSAVAATLQAKLKKLESPVSGDSIDNPAEKIAASLSRPAAQGNASEKSLQKPSLDSDGKKVEASYGRLGINAAKPEILMPAIASPTMPITAAMETTSFDPTPLSFDAWTKDGAEVAQSVEHSSREAVESVLAVSDQLSTGVQRSVKLQFSVGGEDLAVRVELRGDRVHTTFRTDSPELRTALAREWQAVSTLQSGDRGQRLADPVFASSSSFGSNNSFSADSGATHQRDQQSRQAREAAGEAGAFRRALRAQPAAPSVSSVTSPVHVSPQSRRLQTFA
jgi:hypothetical protein